MCAMRSSYYKMPLPHVFTMKQRVKRDGKWVESVHCTWCTRRKK